MGKAIAITGGSGGGASYSGSTPINVSVSNVISLDAGGIINMYLASAAVQAVNMATDAVTYANAALAPLAVVDSNMYSVSISKVLYGTVVLGGALLLARGNGYPLVYLDYTGIVLYSAASASGSAGTPGSTAPSYSASGLTSSPYVVIESSGISLFSGANPSLTLTSSALTFWSVNGSTSSPYALLSSSVFAMYSGNGNYAAIEPTEIELYFGGSTPSAVTLLSTGIELQQGSSTLYVASNYITLFQGSQELQIQAGAIYLFSNSSGGTSYPYVEVTSSGVVVSQGSGSAYVQVSSSSVMMYCNSSNYIEITSGGTVYITQGGYSTTISGNTIGTGNVVAGQGTISALTTSQLTFNGVAYTSSASAGYLTPPSTVQGYLIVYISGYGTFKIAVYNY